MLERLAIVTHEFGIFPRHGGIATSMRQLVQGLVQRYPSLNISVIACEGNLDPKEWPSQVRFYRLKDGLTDEMQREVTKLLLEVNPQVVEVAEFRGLCTDAVIQKAKGHFPNTVFVTNHHTAHRECFEWSNGVSHSLAPVVEQVQSICEAVQMQFSDYQIAPSQFLAQYVEAAYALPFPVEVFPNPYDATQIPVVNRDEVHNSLDLSLYEGSFNILCISRFEGRKEQLRLAKEFVQLVERTGLDARLFLVGQTAPTLLTEDYRFEVFSQVPPALRSRIHFMDYANQARQRVLSALCDVFVLPSTFENFPNAALESVLRGVPTVASCHTGCADFANELSPHLLFNPFEEGDLSRKLEMLAKLDTKGRIGLGARQRDNLLPHIGIERSIVQRIERYRELSDSLTTQAPLPVVFVNSAEASGQFELPASVGRASTAHVVLTGEQGLSPEERTVLSTMFSGKTFGEVGFYLTNEWGVLSPEDVFAKGYPLVLPNLNLTTLGDAKPLYLLLWEVALARNSILPLKAGIGGCQKPGRSQKKWFRLARHKITKHV